MLAVEGLTCGYGDIVAARDLSFSIAAGEKLAFLGANGAGKSSTLMTLMGLVALRAGRISIDGEDVTALPVHRRIARGMAVVPEGRRVFADLSVRENLTVGGHVLDRAAMLRGQERVYEHFPRLFERRDQLAGSLSGGEQQMLAIGRALISEPRLLLVDELSLGLMPKVIDDCYAVLERLSADGMAILFVEQNTERALAVADRCCILEAGNLVWQGAAAAARDDPALTAALLGQD